MPKTISRIGWLDDRKLIWSVGHLQKTTTSTTLLCFSLRQLNLGATAIYCHLREKKVLRGRAQLVRVQEGPPQDSGGVTQEVHPLTLEFQAHKAQHAQQAQQAEHAPSFSQIFLCRIGGLYNWIPSRVHIQHPQKHIVGTIEGMFNIRAMGLDFLDSPNGWVAKGGKKSENRLEPSLHSESHKPKMKSSPQFNWLQRGSAV
jgi:hypothetical protein